MSWLIIDNGTNLPVTGDPVEELPDPLPDGTRAEIVALGYPDSVTWSATGGAYGNGGFMYPEQPQLITVGRFLLRIPFAKQVAIHAAAETDMEVRTVLFMLQGFTAGISLSDPLLAQFLQLMVSKNLLTEDDVTIALAGDAP